MEVLYLAIGILIGVLVTTFYFKRKPQKTIFHKPYKKRPYTIKDIFSSQNSFDSIIKAEMWDLDSVTNPKSFSVYCKLKKTDAEDIQIGNTYVGGIKDGKRIFVPEKKERNIISLKKSA